MLSSDDLKTLGLYGVHVMVDCAPYAASILSIDEKMRTVLIYQSSSSECSVLFKIPRMQCDVKQLT